MSNTELIILCILMIFFNVSMSLITVHSINETPETVSPDHKYQRTDSVVYIAPNKKDVPKRAIVTICTFEETDVMGDRYLVVYQEVTGNSSKQVYFSAYENELSENFIDNMPPAP